MDLLDVLHSIVAALRAVGVVGSQYVLEVTAGCLAVILLCMRIYKFGRDHILKKVRGFMLGDDGFWDRRPKRSIAKHIKSLRDGLPIITVANFKGGVGKSTMVANLAAFYDQAGLRVLLIDFDYQGSLTDAVIKTDGQLYFASVDVIEGKKSVEEVLGRSHRAVANFQNTDVLAAYYVLNRAENRILFKWLIREDPADIRYHLHSYLSSPTIRNRYDLVIIDAPPRLMTATVNALCASTHVIVPTILDGLSSSAALNTVDAILKLRDKISPSLKVAGIVPTFVYKSTGYSAREAKALTYIHDEIDNVLSTKQDSPIEVFEGERILRKEAIANAAGEKVAFFQDAAVRNMYTQLGIALSKCVGGSLERKLRDEGKGAESRSEVAGNNVVQLGL
jgi:chromosome partitioning protein